MPFRRQFRPWSALAGVLAAAATATTVAGCGQIAPLNGGQPAPKLVSPRTRIIGVQKVLLPQPSQPSLLRSPFVLEAVRIQAPARAGRCAAGSVALAGGRGQCYRKIGAPVTINVAGISPIVRFGPNQDAFVISFPASEQSALRAVTTTALDAHGFLVISVTGQSWLLPEVTQPFSPPGFPITLPRTARTLRLHRLLGPRD